ncbi:MAG: sugar phosphate isomerase/epimerase family protein [Phycisphaeraceae bacterium]
MNERLAACSWSFQPDSTAHLIECLGRAGLFRASLCLNPLVEDLSWSRAGATLKDAGIELVSGMFMPIGEDYSTLETIKLTGGIVPDEHWPANRDLYARQVGIATALGLDQITFHAGFIPHDPNEPVRSKVTERLGELADLSRSAGIDLLLETGQETAADLGGFLQALNHPAVGVNFDPANMILYGKGDPIEAVKSLMHWVKQVHIKDALPTPQPGTWGSEERVGSGAVDWPAFLNALQQGGYRGDLVIEREAGDQRVEDIAFAARHISERLAQA